MTLFLAVFTLFNLCAGAAAFRAVSQLAQPDAPKRWVSARLFLVAEVAACGLLLWAIWGVAAGWAFAPDGAPLMLLPVAWLLVSGAVFAIVDFAEDGVFDFGRGPAPKTP